MKAGKVLAIGLFLTGIAGAAAHANLVTNGNFATGDFTGWNPPGSGILINSTFPAPGDSFDAAFSDDGALSQSIPTSPGTSYTLAFSLLDESGFFADTFTVGFGTFSATITGDTAATYTAESFSVPAADITSSSTLLSFQGSNLLSDWNLDDVSVTANAIPEPSTDALFAGAAILVVSLIARVRARQT